MAKRRTGKLVYNGRRGLPEDTHCFWCGSDDANPDYIVNPGGEPLIACCCKEHFDKANEFVRRDNKIRPAFYVILFIFVAIDMVLIGFGMTSKWAYLPLLGIAVTICAWPSVFTHYQFYCRFGLVKTKRVIRVISLALAVLSIAATMSVW
jgi:hypothetical protein